MNARRVSPRVIRYLKGFGLRAAIPAGPVTVMTLALGHLAGPAVVIVQGICLGSFLFTAEVLAQLVEAQAEREKDDGG